MGRRILRNGSGTKSQPLYPNPSKTKANPQQQDAVVDELKAWATPGRINMWRWVTARLLHNKSTNPILKL